jgi:hypothetical protein
MATTNGNRAIEQARWQLQTIRKLLAAYDAARERQDGDFTTLENIHQHPLSVSVRGNWEIPGSLFAATRYQLQLCWGGPAVRLIGDLDGEEPKTARLEYQDWFTPWQELAVSPAETEALLAYGRFFYFGN